MVEGALRAYPRDVPSISSYDFSPVSTLKEAFLAALKESGGGAGGKATIILDSRVLGEFAIDYINGVTETTGVCPVLV